MWKRYIPRVATLARNRAYSSFRTQSTKPSNVYIAVGALGVSVVTYGTLTFSKSTNILCDAESKSSSQIPGDPDMAKKMENLILSKQRQICEALEKVDGKAKFYFDEYDRPDNGGYGISSVISDGNVFEKGGVMLSVVHGRLPPAAVLRMKADHSNIQVPENGFLPFFACGLSLIMHPKNPNVPTVHLNYRYFETTNEDGTPQSWWFGGGADLTPYYLFEEDAVQFHEALQEACDKHSPDYYERFKKWCDEYFYNKHRKESRGIGGIFFDDLADRDPQEIYAFIGDALNAFLKSYIPIVNRRKDLPYTLQQQEWQHIRRGRYVEFNLLHDRGTSFGLMAPNARVESILVSLPKHVQWHYMHEPTPNSPEAQLVDALKTKRDWVNMEKYKDAEKKADQDTA